MTRMYPTMGLNIKAIGFSTSEKLLDKCFKRFFIDLIFIYYISYHEENHDDEIHIRCNYVSI